MQIIRKHKAHNARNAESHLYVWVMQEIMWTAAAKAKQNKTIFQTRPLFVSQAGLVKVSAWIVHCVYVRWKVQFSTSTLNQKSRKQKLLCAALWWMYSLFDGPGEQNAGFCCLLSVVPREFGYSQISHPVLIISDPVNSTERRPIIVLLVEKCSCTLFFFSESRFKKRKRCRVTCDLFTQLNVSQTEREQQPRSVSVSPHRFKLEHKVCAWVTQLWLLWLRICIVQVLPSKTKTLTMYEIIHLYIFNKS